MNIENINPQLQKAYRRIPAVPFHNRFLLPLLQFLSLRQSRAKSIPGITIKQHQLDNCGIRVYQTKGEQSGAGLLWIHGGGYIIGSALMNDLECARYAQDLNITVVSVDYRLAPQHPFPAASDDCFEAWQWIINNAEHLGVSADRFVISGQSAGGGLAAGLVQRIHDKGGVQPAGQALFCPMLDDRTASRSELDDIKHRLWNNKNNRGAWTYYLGQVPGLDQTPPYAVPARRENLGGLPPSWIAVGDVDLFYEEDQRYASRLQEAGVNCEMHIVPGAPHAFEAIAPDAEVSIAIMQSNHQFLRRVLAL
ncbi:alpha/beta hydrolase [Zhongshania marina]|uniref:Alpha/beta hydrolase n=1 Tax=Zhongshania marina TaxID=2304603 RepID=A0A2S4HDA8_9GAMM|nr:alpha/beta hydrolase [Marortus luteolus]POP51947.1 alpha/beta hydrolase [Marortus luteolus]